MEETTQDLTALAQEYTPVAISMAGNVLAAIIILIIGLWIAGWAKRLIRRMLEKSGRVEPTLTSFLGSLARYLIIAFTLIAILGRFGVQTASLVAVLGALGLAIGLALQGTLADVAAGVLLLFFRPFKMGDFVDVGGISGTVKSITLFSTELATPDNRKIIIPNGKIWGNPITNFNGHDTRRVDLVFGISYDDDIDKAISIINDVIAKESRALKDGAHQVFVGNLGDSSVDLTTRIWVNAADYWGVYADTLKTVKERFDDEGVSIPYPHVFHINQEAD
ncbi:MAG: mechanosensitive ion channel [Sphingomonadales bacterium]|jgi:small conductance mechanosensitive channel